MPVIIIGGKMPVIIIGRKINLNLKFRVFFFYASLLLELPSLA